MRLAAASEISVARGRRPAAAAAQRSNACAASVVLAGPAASTSSRATAAVVTSSPLLRDPCTTRNSPCASNCKRDRRAGCAFSATASCAVLLLCTCTRKMAPRPCSWFFLHVQAGAGAVAGRGGLRDSGDSVGNQHGRRLPLCAWAGVQRASLGPGSAATASSAASSATAGPRGSPSRAGDFRSSASPIILVFWNSTFFFCWFALLVCDCLLLLSLFLFGKSREFIR